MGIHFVHIGESLGFSSLGRKLSYLQKAMDCFLPLYLISTSVREEEGGVEGFKDKKLGNVSS